MNQNGICLSYSSGNKLKKIPSFSIIAGFMNMMLIEIKSNLYSFLLYITRTFFGSNNLVIKTWNNLRAGLND
jgi:hypothetical protein